MRTAYLVAATFFALPAAAQSMRSDAEIQATIIGRTATFPDGTRMTWQPNGGYVQNGPRGASTGRYAIAGGQVCAARLGPGGSLDENRCHRLARSGQGFVLIDDRGRSFPIQLK